MHLEHLTPWGYGAVFVGGVFSAALNAVAGGGSLISFPILVAVGIPPVSANATNALAQVPGQGASAFGFRNLLPASQSLFLPLLLPTLVGALLGGWLLTRTGDALFVSLVPFLILVASLLLLFQPQIKKRTSLSSRAMSIWTGVVLQFLVSVYGGYFGAGMGIMMLAIFGLMLTGTLHELNAVKNWLGLLINLVASFVFVAGGLIWVWPLLVMTSGCIIGGFLAAKWSQKLNPDKLRGGIAWVGIGLAAWFMVKVWGLV